MASSRGSLFRNERVRAYGLILLGCLIGSAAYPLFLVPNAIAPGGLTGVATILNYLWGLPVGVTSLALNLPLCATPGHSPFSGRKLFAVEGTGIQIDAVKKADNSDQILLRFHECFGGTEKIRITSDFGIKAFTPCDLLEQPLGETVEADAICRTVRPFEIVNYVVTF